MALKGYFKDTDIYKLTARMVVFIVLSIAMSRFTRGYIMPVYVIAAVLFAFANKLGWALVFFVFLPFCTLLNPILMGMNMPFVYAWSTRLAPLLIAFVLMLRGVSRQGRYRVPLIGMVPFLMVAVISSVDGWAPSVSYMKLANFTGILLGMWYGTQNLQKNPKDLLLVRSFFLALAAVITVGSVMTIAVPGIGYLNQRKLAMEGGLQIANEAFKELQLERNVTLFCGITNQSQVLAPVLAMAMGWALCDMLLIERRFRWLHVLIVSLGLPLIYMTRSRMGLISIIASFFMCGFYVIRKVQLPANMKSRLNRGILLGSGLIIVGAVISQVKGGAMSEWIRKTNDIQSDTRSLGEALTSSRQALMRYSLYEFRRNPLFGSGFQVAEWTQELARQSKGFLLSAPIEKGVTPVMVLGETGIVGEICFIIFLVTFYASCSRRKYIATLSLFTVFFVTNLGEATMFAPGGMGGFMWMVCIVGGFSLDTYVLSSKQMEQQGAAMGFETVSAFEMVEDRSGRKRIVDEHRDVKWYGR